MCSFELLLMFKIWCFTVLVYEHCYGLNKWILSQADSRLPDHLIDQEKVKEVEDKLLGESPRYIYSQIARLVCAMPTSIPASDLVTLLCIYIYSQNSMSVNDIIMIKYTI